LVFGGTEENVPILERNWRFKINSKQQDPQCTGGIGDNGNLKFYDNRTDNYKWRPLSVAFGTKRDGSNAWVRILLYIIQRERILRITKKGEDVADYGWATKKSMEF
jgi:hypothetical protein